MALLEDHEAIQLSIMHVVDGLVKGTLGPTRARLIIQALRIAARNAKNVRFDNCYYEDNEQEMVREVPDYARQYLIEHPEFGTPLGRCSTDTPVCEAEATAAPQREALASQQNVSEESPTAEPAAERRQNAAHGASRGATTENDPAPKQRKKPERELQEENEIKRVQAAIPGAERGNWRDLRTVFEFAGISPPSKEALNKGGTSD